MSKISRVGPPPRLSHEPRRAVAISVDASAGVAGFVAPGDSVDIMLIRKLKGDLVSSIIMEDVLIIGVGQNVGTETTGAGTFRMITVEVHPRDAQKLTLAQQVGRLSLTLQGIGEEFGDAAQFISAESLDDYSKSEDRSLRVYNRGDFGVPRGLCELPPTATTGTKTMCDVVDFPPWKP